MPICEPDPSRYSAILATPFGGFGIRSDGTHIMEMAFLPPGIAVRSPGDAVAEHAAAQVIAWLDDPYRPFDLPLASCGTPFQQRVWAAISRIPPGAQRRYGALAAELDSAARAVGQACGANPYPLAVPCHRVVAASSLGGFANARDGYLLDAKRWLLNFEASR